MEICCWVDTGADKYLEGSSVVKMIVQVETPLLSEGPVDTSWVTGNHTCCTSLLNTLTLAIWIHLLMTSSASSCLASGSGSPALGKYGNTSINQWRKNILNISQPSVVFDFCLANVPEQQPCIKIWIYIHMAGSVVWLVPFLCFSNVFFDFYVLLTFSMTFCLFPSVSIFSWSKVTQWNPNVNFWSWILSPQGIHYMKPVNIIANNSTKARSSQALYQVRLHPGADLSHEWLADVYKNHEQRQDILIVIWTMQQVCGSARWYRIGRMI